MSDFSIQNEKVAQTAALLKERGLDAWLTFVQETSLTPDPALPLILGMNMTWLSAFIHTADDQHVAIVGRFDADNVRKMGAYNKVIAYDQDIFPALLHELQRLNPHSIGLNYSLNDSASNGLSHGLWLLLTGALAGTPFADRLTSAELVIAALRGRKTPTEIAAVRGAIATTQSILAQFTAEIEPGLDEVSIFNRVRHLMEQRGVIPSWDSCPNVTAGAGSRPGHTLPDAGSRLAAGELLHMDIGVVRHDYVSDIQRVWYVAKPGEEGMPQAVRQGFDAVRAAIMAAAEVLKPGVPGWQVDQAARATITSLGYPEYQHAVGHQVGRSVHDGAGILGPRWPRYGTTPEVLVEAGNIFTLELGVQIEGYGFIGLEEDVLVLEDGLEWLSTPQTEIWVVRPPALPELP